MARVTGSGAEDSASEPAAAPASALARLRARDRARARSGRDDPLSGSAIRETSSTRRSIARGCRRDASLRTPRRSSIGDEEILQSPRPGRVGACREPQVRGVARPLASRRVDVRPAPAHGRRGPRSRTAMRRSEPAAAAACRRADCAAARHRGRLSAGGAALVQSTRCGACGRDLRCDLEPSAPAAGGARRGQTARRDAQRDARPPRPGARARAALRCRRGARAADAARVAPRRARARAATAAPAEELEGGAPLGVGGGRAARAACGGPAHARARRRGQAAAAAVAVRARRLCSRPSAPASR